MIVRALERSVFLLLLHLVLLLPMVLLEQHLLLRQLLGQLRVLLLQLLMLMLMGLRVVVRRAHLHVHGLHLILLMMLMWLMLLLLLQRSGRYWCGRTVRMHTPATAATADAAIVQMMLLIGGVRRLRW